MVEFDPLKLENQLCFPLYVCSKEIIRRYKPFLDPLDLTYTQYITLIVLWEKRMVSVKELGECLYLDSGTLTPLLKKLEAKGLIERKRCPHDERCVNITLTKQGEDLREKAMAVPGLMSACVALDPAEAMQLHATLHKILGSLK